MAILTGYGAALDRQRCDQRRAEDAQTPVR